MFFAMTTEYRTEKFSAERSGAKRTRIDLVFLRYKSSLSYVFFNFPLISYPIPFRGETDENPPTGILRTDDPTRWWRDGEKLIIILRVPFNQLSYFFTVVNVRFFFTLLYSVVLVENNAKTTTTRRRTTTTTTTTTRHYI